MSRFKHKLSFIIPDFSSDDGVNAWFTLKNKSAVNSNGGIPGLDLGIGADKENKHVRQRRNQFFEYLNVDPQNVATARQVHSNNVQEVAVGDHYTACDGLVTQAPGLALAIQVADCAAVLLWDSQNSIIAVLHAGWRGARSNIVPLGIKKMKQMGGNTAHFKAFISPCISQQNFEIGNEVAEQFPDDFVEYDDYKKPHLDLKSFLKNQMLDHGLPEDHIEVHPECTVANGDDFYSYRREGEKSGRMLAIIHLNY